MSKPRKITLTETGLTGTELETVQAFIAANRAKKQAGEVLDKLKSPVLALAKKYPTLLVDGARITVGSNTSWSYSAVIAGFRASVAKAEKEEQESGVAKSKTTRFPAVRELSKFTGQAVPGIEPGFFSKLLGRK